MRLRDALLLALLPATFACGAEEEPPGKEEEEKPQLSCEGCGDGSIDLGAVAVRIRAEHRLVLRNVGTVPARLDEIDEALLPGGFATSLGCTGSCNQRLVAPGDALEVVLSYTPDLVGPAAARIELGPDGPTLDLEAVAGRANLSCSPGVIDFGAVLRHETVRQTVVCTNTGTLTEQLNIGPVEGSGAAYFEVGHQPSYVDVAPAEQVEIPITYRAADLPGTSLGTLPFHDRGGLVARVDLEGESLASVLALRTPVGSDGCIGTGYVSPGGEARLQVEVENRGKRVVGFEELRLAGIDTDAFSLGTRPEIIGAGHTATFEIHYRAAEVGVHRGLLRIGTDLAGDKALEVCLTGRTGGPALTCEPALFDFGTTVVGQEQTATFRCTNSGWDVPGDEDARLVVEEMHTSGSAAFSAVVRDGVRHDGYAVSESFEVEVTHAPVDDGADALLIWFDTNVTDGAEATISILGRAEVQEP